MYPFLASYLEIWNESKTPKLFNVEAAGKDYRTQTRSIMLQITPGDA